MKVRNDVLDVLNEIDKNICVVVATKYLNCQESLKLLEYGLNNFGENRVDSFLLKYDFFKNNNIIYHFIGHLQRNKVKQIINKIDYLHSLESVALAKEINKYRINPLDCFIEVKFSKSESKYGVDIANLDSFINEVLQFSNINIVGLMTMCDIDMSNEEICNIFDSLNKLKERYNLKYTSMGMSNDYKIAIKNNATHIRLGSVLLEGEL